MILLPHDFKIKGKITKINFSQKLSPKHHRKKKHLKIACTGKNSGFCVTTTCQDFLLHTQTTRCRPGGKAPPTVREDKVRDYLRNLNIHESTGPEEMHPRVLREWADVVARPLSIIYEVIHNGSQVKSVVTGGRETLCPFLKRVGRKTLGTTDLSASPLCLGRSWNRSS